LNWWEDERWEERSVPVTSQELAGAVSHALNFTIPKGKYSVHIQAEGEQIVRDPKQGSDEEVWKGVITYADDNRYWTTFPFGQAQITNLALLGKVTRGSKDASINSKQVGNYVIQRDFTSSFDLEVKAEQSGLVIEPADIQTTPKYNFVVSYGNYSWKTMEYGTLSVVFDEKVGTRVAPPRIVMPGKPNWKIPIRRDPYVGFDESLVIDDSPSIGSTSAVAAAIPKAVEVTPPPTPQQPVTLARYLESQGRMAKPDLTPSEIGDDTESVSESVYSVQMTEEQVWQACGIDPLRWASMSDHAKRKARKSLAPPKEKRGFFR
jgi:hypothetical protein